MAFGVVLVYLKVLFIHHSGLKCIGIFSIIYFNNIFVFFIFTFCFAVLIFQNIYQVLKMLF